VKYCCIKDRLGQSSKGLAIIAKNEALMSVVAHALKERMPERRSVLSKALVFATPDQSPRCKQRPIKSAETQIFVAAGQELRSQLRLYFPSLSPLPSPLPFPITSSFPSPSPSLSPSPCLLPPLSTSPSQPAPPPHALLQIHLLPDGHLLPRLPSPGETPEELVDPKVGPNTNEIGGRETA
jgi:hypothetical protein